ncbi:DUF7561 family protein [Halostella litorea]|uniref:DUF7561 family protein n=1 Tax=Halostella litorea TaxID=2528831 RepID=UPI0010926012|nr:hypothetical protein [Halostella litorea]
MTTDPCDGCGRPVKIAGGIANLWTFDGDETGGVTLEFDADGSEHFLCYDCIEDLPEDPSAADVAALPGEE